MHIYTYAYLHIYQERTSEPKWTQVSPSDIKLIQVRYVSPSETKWVQRSSNETPHPPNTPIQL